ncbi:MAG TPA: DNA repair exonuclease [Pirellulales bacterium]|nr:DNA repair exonuclease [Pirellulales bacterium]
MFKFIHAADIHLDSPLKGLEQYEGAPIDEIRGATRRALENLARLAIDEEVAFVLIAGDVYDGNWRDFKTGLFFRSEMSRLREADIPVYLISGNHDAANRMTKSLELPDNVTRLPSKKPATVPLERYGVSIHGQGFANAAVRENLAAAYPLATPGHFNIGLLHTSASGSPSHEPYAACNHDDLRSKEYDYWALGHIHQRGEVWGDSRIQFAGNTQGRHIRETGPKGCLVVSVDDRRRADVRFEPLDVFRWERAQVDAGHAENGYDVVDRVANELRRVRDDCDDRPVAVRVQVNGACRAHESLAAEPARWTNEIRAVARDTAAGNIWIEKVKLETSPAHELDSTRWAEGPLAELAEYVAQLQADPAERARLAGELAELKRKLPAELKEGDDRIDLDDPQLLTDALRHVEPMLLGRLRAGGFAS